MTGPVGIPYVQCSGLADQVSYVQKIAEKVGITISMDKSVVCATTPAARKQLAKCLMDANIGGSVVDKGKSLGFEFQWRRASKVNSLCDRRVNEATPKLHKLRVMPWSRAKKRINPRHFSRNAAWL